MGHVFISWSGGKDSCLAYYQAKVGGLEVRYLVNMITEDGKHSWTHGQSAQLLQMQAKSVGIPLIQTRATMSSYEVKFKDTLLALKREGVTGGVFGTIDIEEHKQWIERMCSEVNITPYLPLWGKGQEEILRGFIDSGFEAIVVVTEAELLDEGWLGRKVDMSFLRQLRQRSIRFCGEAGEYQTIVIDGPIFDERIEILQTTKVLREGHWFLKISNYGLASRQNCLEVQTEQKMYLNNWWCP